MSMVSGLILGGGLGLLLGIMALVVIFTMVPDEHWGKALVIGLLCTMGIGYVLVTFGPAVYISIFQPESYNPWYYGDAYVGDTPFDEDCIEKSMDVLTGLNIQYPGGLICSSWLQREEYFSTNKCSCYRGKPRRNGFKIMEVVTYYRKNGTPTYAGEYIRYNMGRTFLADEFPGEIR